MAVDEMTRTELSPATSGVAGFSNAYGSALTDLSKSLDRLGKLKAVGAQVEEMNLVDLRKQLEEIQRLGEEVCVHAGQLATKTANHHMAASENDQREWEAAFRSYLGQRSVEGAFPHFIVFPIEIRVDFGNEQVLVNKRIVRKLHPKAIAQIVERELTRLDRERFNPQRFMKAMIRAFDVLIAESTAKGIKTQAVSLTEVHKLLTLRTGLSSYTATQFAFDIYRFRRQEERSLEGRHVVFGSSKTRAGYPIPSVGGRAEVLGSLEIRTEKAEDHE